MSVTWRVDWIGTLVLASVVVLAPGATAQTVVRHDVMLEKAAGVPGGVRLFWEDRGPGTQYELFRGTNLRDMPGWTRIASTSGLDFVDVPPDVLDYYNLNAILPAMGCADDSFEENDSVIQSVAPAAGWMDLVHCENDPDVFRVTVPSGAVTRGGITYDPAVGNLTLELVAPDGINTLATDPWSVRFQAAVAGVHYYRISGDPDVPYRAWIESDVPDVGCSVDYAAPNHTVATAIAGWPHEPQFIYLSACEGEEDWWYEEVPANHWLNFWVDPFFGYAGEPTDENWMIGELYDESGTLVVQLDSRTPSGIGWDLLVPVATRFTIRVRAFITEVSEWSHTYEKSSDVYPD